MAHHLDGVQAKLDRAFEHGYALRDEIAALPKDEFYNTRQPPHPKRGKNGVMWVDGYVEVLKQPPLKLGVLAGDCAHNLRGCLDHLIYQLALLDTGGKAPRDTCFPVARSEGEYLGIPSGETRSLRDRALAGVSEEHRALVDAEQPYVGRPRRLADKHPLAVLNAFSNTDKHRLVSPTYLLPAHVKVTPIGGTFDVIIQPDTSTRLISNNAHVYSVGLSNIEPDVGMEEVRMVVDFTFSFAFGNRGLTDGDFLNLCAFVRDLIDRFRPHFI